MSNGEWNDNYVFLVEYPKNKKGPAKININGVDYIIPREVADLILCLSDALGLEEIKKK